MASSGFHLARLRKEIAPFRLHFFTSLRSTNDHAVTLRKRGDLFAPAIVLAARQTAGRGRGESTWFSAAGSLTVTFVLPIHQTLAPYQVPLSAGLAVRNAVAGLTGDDSIGLKWPNDIYHGGRKLAGLLCERLDNIDLLGIGVNVNLPTARIPRDLKDRIAFLEQVGRHAFDLTAVLGGLAKHIHQSMIRNSETPFPLLLREYDRHHVLVGRRITVQGAHHAPISGKCEGLDDSGRLLLREAGGGRPGRIHRIISGHIDLR